MKDVLESLSDYVPQYWRWELLLVLLPIAIVGMSAWIIRRWMRKEEHERRKREAEEERQSRIADAELQERKKVQAAASGAKSVVLEVMAGFENTNSIQTTWRESIPRLDTSIKALAVLSNKETKDKLLAVLGEYGKIDEKTLLAVPKQKAVGFGTFLDSSAALALVRKPLEEMLEICKRRESGDS